MRQRKDQAQQSAHPFHIAPSGPYHSTNFAASSVTAMA